MIHETIITTLNRDGTPHLAPMGVRERDGMIVISPYRPSTTLDNLQRTGVAVVNMTDDVCVFAGCLTGRGDWPTVPVQHIRGQRLREALSHVEVEVDHCDDDEIRPDFYCAVRHRETHAPFRGFNRAQGAVLEVAILVSRVQLLPRQEIENGIRRLQTAIDKTAGENEKLAWDWLIEHLKQHKITIAAKEEAV